MEITNREIIDIDKRKFPEKICFKPIGIIHTPFKTLKGIPIQSSMSNEKGSIEVFFEYQPGLKDLSAFSHMYCLYFFDMVKLPVPLQSKPFLDNQLKGVFAIRTPFRPNPIGLSILEILDVKENKIEVNNVDILDNTPLLDLKPFVSQFDNIQTTKIGWLKDKIKNKVS
ncbi:MAG: tRNA (N6-threonylcarbamoyladenosine(37)-N6)-methyltransferase TrmO [Candidatus Lokiarchaeota archaeon]|nr:tRNA (N6-threonylcarbamoyladenosine(37)-N6)-methyltransferase TrmO [Candidatus Lokiarchaeota archaeon]